MTIYFRTIEKARRFIFFLTIEKDLYNISPRWSRMSILQRCKWKALNVGYEGVTIPESFPKTNTIEDLIDISKEIDGVSIKTVSDMIKLQFRVT